MAHSLFEPTPEPIHEKIWRRMKDMSATDGQHDEISARSLDALDARGRQQYLQAVLTTKPIAK
ncbi:MAG: hypothetical protein ABJL55_05140 [Roseibium sp.]